MKKLFNSVLFLFVFISFAMSQNMQLSVSGHIMDETTGTPIINHPVMVNISGGGMTFDYEFFTDNNGYYGNDSLLAYSPGIIQASTYDCMGNPHLQESNINSNYYVFDFVICADSMGQGDCYNWFTYATNNNIDFAFMGESEPPANYYFWNFGDGTTATGQQVSHTYSSNAGDLFLVTLETYSFDPTTGDSCVAISTQEIWVNNNGGDCLADFEYTIDTLPNTPYSVQFNDLSTGDITNWMWDFGDGFESSEQNPTHIYEEEGIYLVCLMVSSDSSNNCFDTYCEEIVLGNGGGNDCIAAFTYYIDTVPGAVSMVQFIDQSQGNPTFYMWDFGDGNFSQEQNPIHIYDEEGIYPVCLTISSDSANNCYDIYCEDIQIGTGTGNDCANFFWYEASGSSSFNFYGESFPLPTDMYYWNFGDGTTATGQQVSHTYDPNVGDVFLVTLETYSYDPATGDSCAAYSVQEVYVGNGGNGCENWFWYESLDNVNFSFFGESFPMPATDYMWDFGDGTTGYGQEVNHAYSPNTADMYIVTLTTFSFDPVTNDSCVAISEQEVWINNMPNDCENWFWYESYGDFTYTFTGESIPFPADYYSWDFGDGTYGTGQQVTHTFDPTLGDSIVVCLTTYSYNPNGDSCMAVSCEEISFGGQMGIELFGTVMAGNSAIDFAMVGLFGMENGEAYVHDFTIADEGTGAYFFEDVPEGDYYIWASLLPISEYYSDYFPTYYGDVLFWSDAELISIGTPNNPYNINLIISGIMESGPGEIEGTISFDNGKGPADNILIVLMDENEIPITYLQSNELGLFNFSELAFGTYKLMVEIPGVNSAIATVVLNEETEIVNVKFIIKGSEAVLSVSALNSIVVNVGEVYPNPVTNSASININILEKTDLQLTIYNQMGQEVSNSEISLGFGNQQIELPVADLDAGFYTIQIKGQNGGSVAKKFIISN